MAFSGDLETILTFKASPLGEHYRSWESVISRGLLDIGYIALMAAQSDGSVLAGPKQLLEVIEQDGSGALSPSFAGRATLRFLMQATNFGRGAIGRGKGRIAFGPEAGAEPRFSATRFIGEDEGMLQRALAGILGPARHNQVVEAVTLRYREPVDSSGNALPVTAVSVGAQLRPLEDRSEYRTSLGLHLAIPSGTNFTEMTENPGGQALKIGSSYTLNNGALESVYGGYRPPDFQDLGAWTAALSQLV
jgi:hypothetical protein